MPAVGAVLTLRFSLDVFEGKIENEEKPKRRNCHGFILVSFEKGNFNELSNVQQTC